MVLYLGQGAEEFYKYPGALAGDLTAPEGLEKFLTGGKISHFHAGIADFKQGVGVAAGAAGDFMTGGERFGFFCVGCKGTAGVEDFHEVYIGSYFLDAPFLESGTSNGFKRMGDIYQASLGTDTLYRLYGRQAVGYGLLEEHTHYLALCGHYLFSDYYLERGYFLHLESAFRRAVVGDGDTIDAEFFTALYNFFQRRITIHGIA